MKKYNRLILISTYITMLYTTMAHITTLNAAMAQDTPLARQIALATTLGSYVSRDKNYFPQNIIDLAIQYHHSRPLKKHHWKPQTINTQNLMHKIMLVPEEECLALSLKPNEIK